MRRSYYILLLLFGLLNECAAQQLSPKQLAALKSRAKTICIDETLSGCTWTALDAGISNKRFVLIGESNHGSREIFLARNDLVKYLHEKHGFDVIVFESGIGELIVADQQKQQLTSAQMLFGLFGPWRTSEFRGLMEYVKSENISIAGFDGQRTGGSFKFVLADEAGSIDSTLYKTLEDEYGVIQKELTKKTASYDSIATATQQLVAAYKKIHTVLSQEKNPSPKRLLCLQSIVNRIDYLSYMLQYLKDKDLHKRWAARDLMMAANIRWLSETIYKNKKMIVIGHNFHISKHNEVETVMGKVFAEQFNNQMYSIGVFPGSGVYADNAGKEKSLLPADTQQLDIKHVISSLPGFVNYLSIPKQKTAGLEWLYNDIIVNETFINLDDSNKMNLSKAFDAILLIKKISMPVK